MKRSRSCDEYLSEIYNYSAETNERLHTIAIQSKNPVKLYEIAIREMCPVASYIAACAALNKQIINSNELIKFALLLKHSRRDKFIDKLLGLFKNCPKKLFQFNNSYLIIYSRRLARSRWNTIFAACIIIRMWRKFIEKSLRPESAFINKIVEKYNGHPMLKAVFKGAV